MVRVARRVNTSFPGIATQASQLVEASALAADLQINRQAIGTAFGRRCCNGRFGLAQISFQG